MPIITGPILDSSGRPANGWLRVRASRPFEIGQGLVTEARATIAVKNGDPVTPTGQWTLPPTPEGVYLTLEQDLDGETLRTFGLSVPDITGGMTYSELLFNRGNGEGGPNPYWWDLTGGLDFPPDAVNGDFGFDSVTGQVWRYQA